MSPDWILRANQTTRPEPPPRTGKGSTTAAWLEYAEAAGYTILEGSSRAAIIDTVESGPPPPPPQPSMTPKVEGVVYQASITAVEAATHLTALDRPTVEVLLDLAKTIDGFDQRPATAPLDNVTVPTFLRYAESLGLTPMARQRLDVKRPKAESALDRARRQWGAGSAS